MKPMKRCNTLLLAGVLALSCFSYVYGSAFAYKAPMIKAEESNHVHKSILLPSEVLNHSKEDLSDLRILDNDGDVIPYFMLENEMRDYAILAQYETEDVDQFDKDDFFYFDFKATGLKENQDIEVSALELVTDASEFAKKVDVLGSYDGMAWEPITQGTVFRVEGSGQRLMIEFPERQKYTWYRLKFFNNAERVSFTELKLLNLQKLTEANDFIETISPPFSVETVDGNTQITVEGGIKNLKLKSLTIETGDTFRRLVSCEGYKGMLYNLDFGDVHAQDLTLGIEGVRTDDSLLITIENGDDAPIRIKGVTLMYETVALVFKARPKDTYELYYGDPSLEKPAYDIEGYRDKVLRDGIDTWTLGPPVSLLPAPVEEAEVKDYGWVLSVVIVAVGVLLLAVCIAALRKKDRGKS